MLDSVRGRRPQARAADFGYDSGRSQTRAARPAQTIACAESIIVDTIITAERIMQRIDAKFPEMSQR